MWSSHNEVLPTDARQFAENVLQPGGILENPSLQERPFEPDSTGHTEADRTAHPRIGGKSIKRMKELGLFESSVHEEDDSIDEENSTGYIWDSGLSDSKDESQDAKNDRIAHPRADSVSQHSSWSSSPANSRSNSAVNHARPRMSSWKAPVVGQLAERVEYPRACSSSDQDSKHSPTLDLDTDSEGEASLAPAKKAPAAKPHRKYKRRVPHMNEVWEVGTFIAKSSKQGMKDLLQQFGEDTDVEPYKSMKAVELAEECRKRQKARRDQKNAAAQGQRDYNITQVSSTTKRSRDSDDSDDYDERGPSKRHCGPGARKTATSNRVTQPVSNIFGLKEASSALKAIKQAARSDMRFDRDHASGTRMLGAPTPPFNDPLTTDCEQYDSDEEALLDTYETMTVVTEKSGNLVLPFAAQSLTRKLLEKKYEILNLEKARSTNGVKGEKIKVGRIFHKLVTQVKKTIRGDNIDPAAEAKRVITAALGIDENGDDVKQTVLASPATGSRVSGISQSEESGEEREGFISEDEDGSDVSQYDGSIGGVDGGLLSRYPPPFDNLVRREETTEPLDEDSEDSQDSGSSSE